MSIKNTKNFIDNIRYYDKISIVLSSYDIFSKLSI